MGSCFSGMEEGTQALYRDGYTYDDRTRYADTQLQPSAPALSMLPEEEEKVAASQKEEEERQLALAIMVSLEPELEGIVSQLSFWQSEPTADASSSSTPSRQGQARVSQSTLSSAQQDQPKGSSSRPECEYCYDAPIGATCDPCGHVGCYNCWVKIQNFDNKCPRCRVVIKKIIKLYL